MSSSRMKSFVAVSGLKAVAEISYWIRRGISLGRVMVRFVSGTSSQMLTEESFICGGRGDERSESC